MLNEYQMEVLPERIAAAIEKINSDFLIAIGERIKEIGDLRPTEVHKLQRMYNTTGNIDSIVNALEQLAEKSESEIYDIFDTVAKDGYEYSEAFYEAKGEEYKPYEKNSELKNYVKATAKQTAKEFKNMAQHTAFSVFGKDGEIVPTYFGASNKVPTTLSETYTKITDLAIQKAQLGYESYQSAMREAMKALADTGIRTIDYATGYSRRLDTAVRQNVLWGVKQCNQEVADIIGDELGADGYEISYHSNPRPSHKEMGGKQYAKGKARTINGVYYPSFDEVKHLLNDYGCRHYKFSIILGVSEPAYSKKELGKMKTKENKKFEFEGKKYTGYEATQMQRKFETAFRKASDRYTIARAAGDKDMMLEEQTKITQLSQKYDEFSKAAGLPTKAERLRSGTAKKASKADYTKMVRDDIAKKKQYNAKSDKAQYEKYISVLGKENMPKTFDLFQDLKYNNIEEWSLLKDYKKSIQSGELTPLADFELYKQINKEIDNIIVGKITNNGIKITGKSKHFIARTIGSVEQRRNGVSVQESLYTITHPDKIDDVVTNENGESQRFLGKNAIVSVNPNTGLLIQVNPRHKRKEK